MTTLCAVNLWGRLIGAVSIEEGEPYAVFEYAPEFVGSGIELSPLLMPLERGIYSFPELPLETFYGLPGMLADSLPDRYGNALIDAWLATTGRDPASFNSVERLCYTGTRGMGALEFEPETGPLPEAVATVEVAALVELASQILSERKNLKTAFADGGTDAALADILRVGTSAGGARAKAVIAWNRSTGEVRSGQIEAGTGFEHWLLKFDGVRGNRDKELDDPAGFGAIEFAYYEMALAAGIEMPECRLLEENNRRHFMTRRFDRTAGGGKLHMQTLCGMAHFDFNQAGAYSYEQAFAVIRRLRLPMAAVEEQFRRMAFNIVARNQDDHVKNIAFLMNKLGQWRLSPAYDMTYSFNPDGAWTSRHQMSMAGKHDGFTVDDFIAIGKTVSLKRGRARKILEEVSEAVRDWPLFAKQANVNAGDVKRVQAAHRTNLTARA